MVAAAIQTNMFGAAIIWFLFMIKTIALAYF
jgi:hypothetical protein